MLRRLLEGASGLLPSQCAVCHAWPAEPVCAACTARFTRRRSRCVTCALPVAANVPQCGRCQRRAPPLDACFAAVDYDYPWAGCITAFKFGGAPGWSATLAQLLVAAPGVAETLARAELVAPLPLSAARLRERGFNQALELARHFSDETRLRPTLLLRIRETAAQSSLDRAERLANLRGAFALDPLQASAVAGRRVVLVDDVMTSGASLWEAAGQLRQAGAAHITALVVARTDEA
jgi:ComF family protein